MTRSRPERRWTRRTAVKGAPRGGRCCLLRTWRLQLLRWNLDLLTIMPSPRRAVKVCVARLSVYLSWYDVTCWTWSPGDHHEFQSRNLWGGFFYWRLVKSSTSDSLDAVNLIWLIFFTQMWLRRLPEKSPVTRVCWRRKRPWSRPRRVTSRFIIYSLCIVARCQRTVTCWRNTCLVGESATGNSIQNSPDFRKLHEAHFSKMESIDSYVQRRNKQMEVFRNSVKDLKVYFSSSLCGGRLLLMHQDWKVQCAVV